MTLRPLMRPLAAMILASTWHFGVVATANAQAQSPGAGPSEQAPHQLPDISDQQLDAAAAALDRMAGIRQDYEAQISKAEPSEKEHIVDEGNRALEKVVMDHGLSVEEFNNIIVVARLNPDLREKILRRLRPQRHGEPVR